MEKFDLKSAKFVSIILLICFIFIMVIWNAYSYLPPKQTDLPDVKNEVRLPEDTSANNEEPSQNEEENSPVEVSGTINVDQNEGFEEVSVPESAVNTEIIAAPVEQESYEQVFEKAKQYKTEKQYVKALEAYHKAAELSDNNVSQAECYEEISNIYGIVKRYGTALSFAQKAYNLAPSTQREVLLARLYYKTGDIDKATKRINNVLQRDFIVEK